VSVEGEAFFTGCGCRLLTRSLLPGNKKGWVPYYPEHIFRDWIDPKKEVTANVFLVWRNIFSRAGLVDYKGEK